MKARRSVEQDKVKASPRRDLPSLYAIVESTWFAAGHFFLTVASAIALFTFPTTLLPLALSAIPLLLRMVGRRVLIGRYSYHFFALIFLGTAMVGFWAAYDPVLAWIKYRLLLVGILLFYAIITQPKQNMNLLAGFWFVFGVGVAVYFLLTVDFETSAAKFSIINQVGLGWMSIRPEVHWASIQPPDTAAGISLITSIYGLNFLIPSGVGRKNRPGRLLIIAGFAIVLVAFLLATSRGAIVALVAAMGMWLIWLSVKQINLPNKEIVARGFPVLAISFILLVAAFLIYGSSFTAAGSLLQSRMELIQYGVSLTKDFPWIGGGLGSLPGLLSQYIRVIPFFFILNSHNLFIDVMIEQGVIGGFSYLILFGIGLWKITSLLTKRLSTEMQVLSWTAFGCIFIAAVHGLVDDYLYGGWGSVLVLFPVAMCILISEAGSEKISGPVDPSNKQRDRRGSKVLPGLIALVLFFIVLAFMGRKITASWFANLGAVEMAKIELAGFPSGHWSEGEQLGELLPAKTWFERSLQYDPDNRLANYRLGLIQMLERDYVNACQSLAKAYVQDPKHRGIIKNLGYCYAWIGETEKSRTLLEGIPEAQSEMKVYIWWWSEQGREDLSRAASVLAGILDHQP